MLRSTLNSCSSTKPKAADNTTQQLTLADALQQSKKFPTESLKALAITHTFLEFVVLHAQPMSVVEDEGFHHLLEYSSITVYSLLLIQQQYWIGIGYRQIHKTQASVSGLKKLGQCIPNLYYIHFKSNNKKLYGILHLAYDGE